MAKKQSKRQAIPAPAPDAQASERPTEPTWAECAGWAFYIRRHIPGDYRVQIDWDPVDYGMVAGQIVHVPGVRCGVACTSWPVGGMPDIADLRRQLDAEPPWAKTDATAADPCGICGEGHGGKEAARDAAE